MTEQLTQEQKARYFDWISMRPFPVFWWQDRKDRFVIEAAFATGKDKILAEGSTLAEAFENAMKEE
jgi:hypothetical protein